jgi:hypothetical protein
MKSKLFAILAILAIASAAVAAPEFRSADKLPVYKDGGAIGGDKGLLDCSGAIEISLDNSYSGDNTGLPDNVSTYGCSSWSETGGEVVYHLYLAEPTMFAASITPSGCDLDLAVLDGCDESLNCLIVVDSGVETVSPVSGDIYFVVDGYNGAGCPFTFDIATVTPPPPASFCEMVEDVTGTEFSGSTCAGTNMIESMACGTYSEAGLEYYYEIMMPAGSSFTADVTNTADGALWLVDACADPMNCLAYADDTYTGGTESISYTNASGSDMMVYLVIDSWGADTCGDYTMSFTASGGAVAEEGVSFGAAKAMFR